MTTLFLLDVWWRGLDPSLAWWTLVGIRVFAGASSPLASSAAFSRGPHTSAGLLLRQPAVAPAADGALVQGGPGTGCRNRRRQYPPPRSVPWVLHAFMAAFLHLVASCCPSWLSPCVRAQAGQPRLPLLLHPVALSSCYLYSPVCCTWLRHCLFASEGTWGVPLTFSSPSQAQLTLGLS